MKSQANHRNVSCGIVNHRTMTKDGACVTCQSVRLAKELLAANPLSHDYFAVSKVHAFNRRPEEFLVPPLNNQDYDVTKRKGLRSTPTHEDRGRYIHGKG